MGEKIITIEIDDQGNSSLDLKGVQGKGCGDVAAALRANDYTVNSKPNARVPFPSEQQRFTAKAEVKPDLLFAQSWIETRTKLFQTENGQLP